MIFMGAGIGCISKMGSLSFESPGACLVGRALPCPARLASELARFAANRNLLGCVETGCVCAETHKLLKSSRLHYEVPGWVFRKQFGPIVPVIQSPLAIMPRSTRRKHISRPVAALRRGLHRRTQKEMARTTIGMDSRRR
jgi:hypothetical protein